ncbi:MAG: TIGR00730 family Rossman fold protein [Minwuia sp.]|nr:TIGR00730 family Rossman fold protein [Minwuia sp.]
MASLSSLCVYCGSSDRARPAFLEAAERLGRLMADARVDLVYGGGRLGLMGRVADGVLAGNGSVVGIIPDHLHRVEVRHEGVTELLIVDTMHERKAEMFRRSDAFCVLPGGIGTLDEVVEILTWRQLGLHDDPIVIVNQDGFFTPFRALLDHIVAENFAGQQTLDFLTWVDTVDDVLPAIAALPEPELTPNAGKL